MAAAGPGAGPERGSPRLGRALTPLPPPVSHPGRRENGERPHQPESGGAGRLRGAVQDQAAHPAQQADEGLLRAAGRRGPAGPGVVGAPLLSCHGPVTVARRQAERGVGVLAPARCWVFSLW